MVFSSIQFIFLFLPAFFLIYALMPKIKMKNAVIFIGSLVFYSFGVLETPVYIPLFIQTILVNYLLGRLIQNKPKLSKVWLIIGIVYDLFWLLFFKYSGFFVENLNHLHLGITEREILLPIGISFYTFQNMSYLIDVYWHKVKPAKSFIDYGAYISMFPQLIAGPIVNYKIVRNDLTYRTHSIKKVDSGLRTFLAGLGFKMLIANQLSGLWSDLITIGYDSISSPLAWMGIAAYSFQLYFDFYGYSLMAIGLGQMMGFKLPQNFNDPYSSVSMTEFWRRWHITLGTWFREYVYIPLGGNRKGKSRTILNLFVVWTLTGFWHGASWNFILWGMFLFVILFLEKNFIGDFLEKHRTMGHYYMLLLIPISWTLFSISDLHQLGIFFTRLFPFIPHEAGNVMQGDYALSWSTYWKYFIAAVLFCTPLPRALGKKLEKQPIVTGLWYTAVFAACVYCMYMGQEDPFMYFRF